MKNSLSNLLKKLEESQVYPSDVNISSINDALSKMMKKGGYDTTNVDCHGGSNTSCHNGSCSGTSNASCLNVTCVI